MIGCANASDDVASTEPEQQDDVVTNVPEPRHDYGNIDWGMSKEEVKDAGVGTYSEERVEEDGVEYLYFAAEFEGVPQILKYRFVKGRLEAILALSETMNLNKAEVNIRYWNYYDKFCELYGSPIDEKDYSPSDAFVGMKIMKTAWQDGTNEIQLWLMEMDGIPKYTCSVMPIDGEYKKDTEELESSLSKMK